MVFPVEGSGERSPVGGMVGPMQSTTVGTQRRDTMAGGLVDTQCVLERPIGSSKFSASSVRPDLTLLSALGEDFDSTPQIVPVRANLDMVRTLMKGDCYVGRGSRQRGLEKSRFANPYKVASYGRESAVALFRQDLETDQKLRSSLWTLSGLRLICHCGERQSCHADCLIAAYEKDFPGAFNRSDLGGCPPSSQQLNYLARLREEVPSDDGSSADEGSAPKHSGWIGKGLPLQVGVGYTVRDYCDGQSLCSPGRWALAARRYPETETWQEVVSLFRTFARQYGTAKLLMDLALGRVEEMPFPSQEVASLKAEIISALQIRGLRLNRQAGDRDELPVDFRFIDLLLRASEDPERHLGSFAQGVKVGPGSRMPRLPALYKAKRRWRLPEQRDPMNYLEEEQQSENPWRQNYATVAGLADKVLAVLEDQVSRGQVRKYTEAEAVAMYPGLVIASLGANRKDKPNGVVTARVLHDGTNGLAVNTRTRIRDQERSPIASDLKRGMREKADMQQPTFALTADVCEAHRQVPIHPDDWKFLGCRVEKGGSVYVNTVGTFGISSASYYWSRVAGAIGRLAQYLAGHSSATWHMLVADDFHLEAGGQDYRFFALCILYPLRSLGCAAVVGEDGRRRHSDLGWFRVASPLETTGNFTTSCRVVHGMDLRCLSLQNYSYEVIRGSAGPSHVRFGRAGV